MVLNSTMFYSMLQEELGNTHFVRNLKNDCWITLSNVPMVFTYGVKYLKTRTVRLPKDRLFQSVAFLITPLGKYIMVNRLSGSLKKSPSSIKCSFVKMCWRMWPKTLTFAQWLGRAKKLGLGGLTSTFLGVQLDKDWRIRSSSWEDETLSQGVSH